MPAQTPSEGRSITLENPSAINQPSIGIDAPVLNGDGASEWIALEKLSESVERVGGMVVCSDGLKKIIKTIERLSPFRQTVLIEGESGTGKELIARALHSSKTAPAGPFVTFNCSNLVDSLAESQLFGHVKGAFTDARTARPGLFVTASGGTLLLDEIGEMPMGMQAKLLRALQERTARPVGGDSEVPFDARVIAATNRDLEAAVAARTFRQDLYYRINVVHIPVPALRERENDVLLLAQSFLERSKANAGGRILGLTSGAAQRLLAYTWPGNVRELQNCIERAMALSQFDHIGVDDLPERISRVQPTRLEVEIADVTEFLPMDEIERRYVAQVLAALGGNKASAARALGMDRRTLYRKLDAWASGKRATESELPPEGKDVA